jgi:cobalt-zinc-cadmium efflux system membrane fusion protein
MNRILIALFIASLVFACRRSDHAEEHGHSHDAEPTLAYTLYSEKTELFVEFKPLVVGQSARFAAHFTKLGEHFTALEEGTITLSLIVNDKGIRQVSEAPGSPGIFRLALKPTTAGQGKLIFDIKTKDYTDRISIDSVTVFRDEKTAREAPAEESPEGGITFLKEQAWKIEFATEELQLRSFNDVIKVAGQLSAKPSDEQVVTARSNGIVRWNDQLVPGAQVKQGQQLFVLASGDVTQGNIESQYKEAKVNFEKAEADYNRVQPLLADKIISQKDYLEIKSRYDQTKIQFEILSRNYTQGGQAIQSPISGFIKQVTARSGEYVESGQALAVITKDQSLQLQAEVPLRYSNQLPLVSEAHFKTLHDNQVYSTKELNGKVLSYGKAIGDAASLLPIYFSLTNNGLLIPGDAVEVFLKSKTIPDALVVPIAALIEEQGKFYVYVQVAGESFAKRAVTLGAQDGSSAQVTAGVNAGDRVVTKGAYLIKLATQSGSVPAHGHEH